MQVTATIGSKLWAAFHVDAVADGIHMAGQPDRVPPRTDVEVLDRDRTQWRAYPLVLPRTGSGFAPWLGPWAWER